MSPSLQPRVTRPPRRRLRRVLFVGVALLLLLGAARVVSLQGLIRPVRIAGGSMAPAFLGPRYEITCGDCGYRWAIDAAQTQGDDVVVCPNCGYRRNELSAASPALGEQVLIDRAAYRLRSPRRFEPAAFCEPGTPDRLAVKRVVALPRESLEVRGGELFLDGRLVRKSLARFREMAVPVHDDRFRPSDASLPSRWRDDERRWARSGDTYYYPGDTQPPASRQSDPQFSWLTYHHWRCSPLPGLRTKETPVLDDFGYNLGPSRQLNFVTDLALECRVQTTGEGCLAVLIHDGRRAWQLRLRPRHGEASLWRENEQVAAASFPPPSDEPFRLEAAYCDGRILAAIDGREVLAYAINDLESKDSAAELRHSATPLALGAAGLAVEASDLVITRDVVYLPPPGRGAWKAGRLGRDEYILLGDNAAVSQDSRAWPKPALAHSRLLGPVLRRP